MKWDTLGSVYLPIDSVRVKTVLASEMRKGVTYVTSYLIGRHISMTLDSRLDLYFSYRHHTDEANPNFKSMDWYALLIGTSQSIFTTQHGLMPRDFNWSTTLCD